MYYLTDFVGQESTQEWLLQILFFRASQVAVQAGATLILRFHQGGSASSFTLWQDSVACGLLTRSFLESLALCGPLNRAVPNLASGLYQSEQVRDQVRRLSFYKLTSEVTSHHFCCMLLIKSQSLGPTHTQRVDYQDVGSLADILEATSKITRKIHLHLPQIPKSHCIATSTRSLSLNFTTEIRSGYVKLLRYNSLSTASEAQFSPSEEP